MPVPHFTAGEELRQPCPHGAVAAVWLKQCLWTGQVFLLHNVQLWVWVRSTLSFVFGWKYHLNFGRHSASAESRPPLSVLPLVCFRSTSNMWKLIHYKIHCNDHVMTKRHCVPKTLLKLKWIKKQPNRKLSCRIALYTRTQTAVAHRHRAGLSTRLMRSQPTFPDF